jgi:DNA-binding MarR family transcriptional regulator
MPTSAGEPDALSARLGYLLKHAQLRLAGLSSEALAPFGINGRELAVLSVLASREPLSQLEAAGRLGLDRTTMVALIDALEAKGLVERLRSPHDRRKNIIPLTAAGQDCLRRAEQARLETEQRFLAPLSPQDADHLVRTLQALVAAPPDAGA